MARDERWGRTYESFSEDPELVARLGAAAVRGLQNGGLNNPLAVLATAKHFAGDGGTAFGMGGPQGALLDQGDTRLDEAIFRRIHVRSISTLFRRAWVPPWYPTIAGMASR